MNEEQEVSVGSKPHHVRKLLFAQMLLKHDSAYDEYGQDKNGRLIIDGETSRIPSMSKIEFVQKWIDTHDNYFAVGLTDDVSRTDDSKYVNHSIHEIENGPGSPIVGTLKKRYTKCMERKKYLDDNRNVDRSISESDHSPLQPKDINIQSSPILGKGQNRRRYRKLSYQRSNNHKCDYYSKSNSLKLQVQCNTNALEVSTEGPPVKRAKKSVLKFNECRSSCVRGKIIFDATKNLKSKEVNRSGYSKDKSVIEEGVSKDAKSNNHETATRSSMIIDDSDTEDHTCHADALCPCNLSCDTVETRDLDATYFSNAENLRPPVSLLLFSQSISSATPVTNQHSESIVISTDLSPRRTPSDPGVFLRVMDSGKKRKKPKRGSLVERLQSLINDERSSVRIWRHCLKHPAKRNINNPYVTIYVESCILRFDKQLLKGIVVEDFASLLSSLNFEASHEQNKARPRDISILISPEVAGKIGMTSKCIVQIAPPWMLLDSRDLLLAVSCMTVASSDSITGIKMEKTKVLAHDEHMRLEKFNCSCNLDSQIFNDCALCSSQCIERSNEPNASASLITDE